MAETTGSKAAELLEAPVKEYQRRMAAWERARQQGTRRESQVGNGRVLTFVAGVALAWLGFSAQQISPAWAAVPVPVFLVLVLLHQRVRQSLARAQNALDYYAQGLARLEDRWKGSGWDGQDLAPKEHPYANDLDLFGPGSLFQLLCTAQTRSGAKTLADWLCGPAPAAEIRARQAAVKALRANIDLREELAHLGRHMQTSVSPEALAAWMTPPPELASKGLAVASVAVSAATLVSFVVFLAGGPFLPFSISLILLAAAHAASRKRVQHILSAAEEPSRELDVVGKVLTRLEREPFTEPGLRELQHALREGERNASRAIARLQRLLRLRESSLNFLFAPFAFAVMWDFHFARAIDFWRVQHGPAANRWIKTVGRLEALCAISAYAYEHPADPFAEISNTGPFFSGVELGHPLLPATACVRNDVTLDAQKRLLLVSGSNMSGKTVLLRTVGINTVLALAGAPVRAKTLTLSVLAVGATLNVHDAIQDGVSRFYAEIKRLRLLMDIAQGGTPLLFLLDEIFHGTNSWDRRAGAEAVLRGYLETGAIGIITTHDLAITELDGEFKGMAENVHFEDRIEEGRLVFDYRLRPGVVRRSNALELMRAIGLRVT